MLFVGWKPLPCSLFGLQSSALIKSLADPLTEKIFGGEDLTKKEARPMGDITFAWANQEHTDVSFAGMIIPGMKSGLPGRVQARLSRTC